MFAAGQKDMQRMDQYTMETLGLPGIVLMENAGARVAEEVLALAPRRAAVLAGGGNNGGDGFVIARRLIDAGIETILCMLADPAKVKGDAKVHLEVYLKRKLPLCRVWETGADALRDVLARADVIVDAMLGTGVRGEVREPYAQAIRLVNERDAGQTLIAVDVPSGLSSDDGSAPSGAVRADRTVTFVFPKKGFFLGDGPAFVGEWKAVDISVPPSIVKELSLDLPQVVTEERVKAALPQRPARGHKGTFGHVLVVGGSRPYVGAPIFAAKAALAGGAGLVTLAVPDNVYPLAAAQVPEALLLPLPEQEGRFGDGAIEELAPQLDRFRAAAVGPGLSRFPGGEAWLKRWFDSLKGQPVVLDADALYLLRGALRETAAAYAGEVILTPHPGEMAALTGRTVQEVEADRLGAARSFAKEHGVYVVLKGHRSLIAAPDGALYINPCGNDALGKGGSGDVLTGLIASFLAQGASPVDACIAAVYVHARSGEEQGRILSRYSVMPFDVIDGVKEELARLS